MKKYNIIIAHPERLIAQGLSALIQDLAAVVQLSDMPAAQSCFFNSAPLVITQAFDQRCAWLLLADLGGLLTDSLTQIKPDPLDSKDSKDAMGLGLYVLKDTQVINGCLNVAEFKWLGDISYRVTSDDFLAIVQSYLNELNQQSLVASAYELGMIFSTQQEVAESYEACAIKCRVGVQ